jgi:hypothetical protein
MSVMIVAPALKSSEDKASTRGANPGLVCAVGADGALSGPVAGFDTEALHYAAQIVATGKEMGLPERAWVIAVATAMQESSLRNLSWGDETSVGLFQQQQWWGTFEQRTNPRESSRLFYEKLIEIPGWDRLDLTDAADGVQRSAHPDAYAKWEDEANQVVGAVEGIACSPVMSEEGAELGQLVVQAALKYLGTDYAWGGGGANGPGPGQTDRGGEGDRNGDPGKIGFDCSGLAQYAYKQIGILIPRNTQMMWNKYGSQAIKDKGKLLPGDLLMLGGRERSTSNVHHVGIYKGWNEKSGQVEIVEAPRSGLKVRVIAWSPGSNYDEEFIGALRPWQVSR